MWKKYEVGRGRGRGREPPLGHQKEGGREGPFGGRRGEGRGRRSRKKGASKGEGGRSCHCLLNHRSLGGGGPLVGRRGRRKGGRTSHLFQPGEERGAKLTEEEEEEGAQTEGESVMYKAPPSFFLLPCLPFSIQGGRVEEEEEEAIRRNGGRTERVGLRGKGAKRAAVRTATTMLPP